jgi:hypothetical protein
MAYRDKKSWVFMIIAYRDKKERLITGITVRFSLRHLYYSLRVVCF